MSYAVVIIASYTDILWVSSSDNLLPPPRTSVEAKETFLVLNLFVRVLIMAADLALKIDWRSREN